MARASSAARQAGVTGILRVSAPITTVVPSPPWRDCRGVIKPGTPGGVMRARVVMAALAVAVCSACASSGGASKAKSGGSRSQDFIGEVEIAQRAHDAANALAVIERLRPQMLS